MNRFINITLPEGTDARMHLGRNGYFLNCGVSAAIMADEIHINGISSRGLSEAARVVVPVSKARELAAFLIAAADAAEAEKTDTPA